MSHIQDLELLCRIHTELKSSMFVNLWSHAPSRFMPSKVFIYVKGNLVCNSVAKPTGYVTHQQFNIQQLYALPTLYLCVLYLSEDKQRLVPLNSINRLVFITEMKSVYCAVRTGSLNKAVCASYLKG